MNRHQNIVFVKCEDATDWPFSQTAQVISTGESWYSANHSFLHTIPEVVSELFLPEPLPNALDTATKEGRHNVNGVDGV